MLSLSSVCKYLSREDYDHVLIDIFLTHGQELWIPNFRTNFDIKDKKEKPGFWSHSLCTYYL